MSSDSYIYIDRYVVNRKNFKYEYRPIELVHNLLSHRLECIGSILMKIRRYMKTSEHWFLVR